MKRTLCMFLSLLLLLTPVLACAEEDGAFDPAYVKEQAEAVLAESFPNISSQTVVEEDEYGDITFLLNDVPVATLCFNHAEKDGTVTDEGVKNHFSLLIAVSVTDQESVQMFVSLYTVFGAVFRHILYPELTIQDCADAVGAGLQSAIDAGDENTGSAEVSGERYTETYAYSMLGDDTLLLSYQVRSVAK